MIYFDSGATTLQKPPAVARATALAMGRMASPGRGGHRPGLLAAQATFRCRELAAELFHVPTPEQVVLTFNATHGLNIAIETLVKPGMSVLISGYEHNAVTRKLASVPEVAVKVASARPFDRDGMLADFRRKMTPEVDVVICNHVSNVFGFILPVDEIGKLCAERGKSLIIDASQSAGTLPVYLDELNADFIAMPGHKGLYGPQGTGLLLCGERVNGAPVLFGGTGSLSALQTMPEFLPDRLEAGTHNVCGIAGLTEGIRFVCRKGQSCILRHEQALTGFMVQGLKAIPGVEVFSGDPETQSGLCSFRAEQMDCETLGEALARRGIAVRAGLHCAPLAHRSAGTEESGTVRISFSAFNSRWEVEKALQILREILSC